MAFVDQYQKRRYKPKLLFKANININLGVQNIIINYQYKIVCNISIVNKLKLQKYILKSQ